MLRKRLLTLFQSNRIGRTATLKLYPTPKSDMQLLQLLTGNTLSTTDGRLQTKRPVVSHVDVTSLVNFAARHGVQSVVGEHVQSAERDWMSENMHDARRLLVVLSATHG